MTLKPYNLLNSKLTEAYSILLYIYDIRYKPRESQDPHSHEVPLRHGRGLREVTGPPSSGGEWGRPGAHLQLQRAVVPRSPLSHTRGVHVEAFT